MLASYLFYPHKRDLVIQQQSSALNYIFIQFKCNIREKVAVANLAADKKKVWDSMSTDSDATRTDNQSTGLEYEKK